MTSSPEPLCRRFPTPEGPQLRAAFHNLFLAANGTEDDKRRLGNPAQLPRPWDPPTCTTPQLRAELWTWLEAVVTWINHEYVWDHAAGVIPACWPSHPHLVHEIAVLADQRRRAGIDPTSGTMEEWHRYCLPGFLDRLKARTRTGCDEQHATWPARSRYTRHTSIPAAHARQAAYRQDLAGITPPQPEATPVRPALQLVTDGGDHIDPTTGEVLP